MKKWIVSVVFYFLSFGYSVAESYLVFINSDEQVQQKLADELNDKILNENFINSKFLYLIDISSSAKSFRGELQYLHDSQGYYMSKYLPTELPQVIIVYSNFKMERYSLTDFINLNSPSTIKGFI